MVGGRPPLVEELDDVFGGHGASSFEFAALLTEEEFAGGIEDGESGDAAVERNIVFFGNVEIFVHLADVDVDDKEGLVEGGGDFGAVESFVKNMAIQAPVAAKDDQDAPVRSGGGVESFSNFLVSVGVGRIEIFSYERLREARGIGALGDAKTPFVVGVEPALSHGDIMLLESGALLGGEGKLENQDVKAGLRIIFLHKLRGEIGEALGFPEGPEGELVFEGDRLVIRADQLGLRSLAVEGGKSGGITGENRGAPFLKGSGSDGGNGLLRGSNAGEE